MPINHTTDELFVLYKDESLTLHELANRVGATYDQVRYRIINHPGYKAEAHKRKKDGGKKNAVEFDEVKALELYLAGVPLLEIEKIVGVSVTTITDRIRVDPRYREETKRRHKAKFWSEGIRKGQTPQNISERRKIELLNPEKKAQFESLREKAEATNRELHKNPEWRENYNEIRRGMGWRLLNDITAEEQKLILAQFAEGKSMTKTAEEIGVHPHTVQMVVKILLGEEAYKEGVRLIFANRNKARQAVIATTKIHRAGTVDNQKRKGPGSRHSAKKSDFYSN